MSPTPKRKRQIKKVNWTCPHCKTTVENDIIQLDELGWATIICPFCNFQIYTVPKFRESYKAPISNELRDLAIRFTYHPPSPEQKVIYEEIRAMAFKFANKLIQYCPNSRERSLAMTKLEEVVMWANVAIARSGK